MQLLVRTLQGGTAVVAANAGDTVADLKQHLSQVPGGLPSRHQVLAHSGRLLDDEMSLAACGLEPGSTVHQTSRLLGGKPVKVKIITNHLPCGQEVTVDLEPSASKAEIKRALEVATGVPAQHQKVLLSGINQIVMGDKRTNIGFSACGSSSGVEMAVNSK